jgi:hypothetical protein
LRSAGNGTLVLVREGFGRFSGSRPELQLALRGYSRSNLIEIEGNIAMDEISKHESEFDDHMDRLALKFRDSFTELLEKREREQDPKKIKKLSNEALKAMMKDCFMTNANALEQDFERLWPRIYDQHLIDYTFETYDAVLERMAEMMADELGDEFDDDELEVEDEVEDEH